MKTLYITEGGNICIDPEEDYVNNMPCERESINRIYVAKEPMHVVYGCGEYKRELDVKKDDIIITFYTSDFKERIVVAKSKDWVNNLKEWNKAEQKRKEEWAAKQDKGVVPPCETCECANCCAA